MAVADPRDDEAGKSDMKHLRGGEDEDGGTDPDVDKKKIKEPSTRTADGVNDDNPSDKGTSYLFFFLFKERECQSNIYNTAFDYFYHWHIATYFDKSTISLS
jgi:hypothetical protein